MLTLLLGITAGIVSTVAGMGGGMLLVLSLSLMTDALTALAASAPALLLANLHRTWLYRRSLDVKLAGAFAVGAVPGALLGALAAVSLPDGAVPWILLVVALFAVTRGLGWVRFEVGAKALAPAGAVSGGLAAVSGGGMVGTILFGLGLRGDVFIATASAAAAGMHLARAIGYGVGGLFEGAERSVVVLLAVGLVSGNLLGKKVRAYIGDERAARASYLAMATLVTLALAGLA